MSKQLHVKNHFVPQAYLKRFSLPEKQIWKYSTLVSYANVPLWSKASLRGVACHSHLYTSVLSGSDKDDMEHWLGSLEARAGDVIGRMCSGARLSPDDWEIMAEFVAAQDLRTPARFIERCEAWSKMFPRVVDIAVPNALQKLRSGEKFSCDESLEGWFPIQIKVRNTSCSDSGLIDVRCLLGRELWLAFTKSLLLTTAAYS